VGTVSRVLQHSFWQHLTVGRLKRLRTVRNSTAMSSSSRCRIEAATRPGRRTRTSFAGLSSTSLTSCLWSVRPRLAGCDVTIAAPSPCMRASRLDFVKFPRQCHLRGHDCGSIVDPCAKVLLEHVHPVFFSRSAQISDLPHIPPCSLWLSQTTSHAHPKTYHPPPPPDCLLSGRLDDVA
jgi:hypothetical protein